jgi:hypothetical protein
MPIRLVERRSAGTVCGRWSEEKDKRGRLLRPSPLNNDLVVERRRIELQVP